MKFNYVYVRYSEHSVSPRSSTKYYYVEDTIIANDDAQFLRVWESSRKLSGLWVKCKIDKTLQVGGAIKNEIPKP